jgi:hypothetical protein
VLNRFGGCDHAVTLCWIQTVANRLILPVPQFSITFERLYVRTLLFERSLSGILIRKIPALLELKALSQNRVTGALV